MTSHSLAQIESANTRTADCLASRTPSSAALEIILKNGARIVEVSDDAIDDVMRIYCSDTHNISEGVAVAPLAGALAESILHRGEHIRLVLSGGDVDASVFTRVLSRGGAA